MTARPQHTPEPWRQGQRHPGRIIAGPSATAGFVCRVTVQDEDDCDPQIIEAANAARIVACVNALAGLNPEAVPALVEAAAKVLRFSRRTGVDAPGFINLRAALAAVRGES
jgi:hypothetical protein